jgi:K+-sensing histidine kinase KdpD
MKTAFRAAFDRLKHNSPVPCSKFRSGASRTAVDGHGLGLAIAQRVVQAHDGEISVANRDGGGLQVTITLPAAGR